jgi:hypothetical protein
MPSSRNAILSRPSEAYVAETSIIASNTRGLGHLLSLFAIARPGSPLRSMIMTSERWLRYVQAWIETPQVAQLMIVSHLPFHALEK